MRLFGLGRPGRRKLQGETVAKDGRGAEERPSEQAAVGIYYLLLVLVVVNITSTQKLPGGSVCACNVCVYTYSTVHLDAIYPSPCLLFHLDSTPSRQRARARPPKNTPGESKRNPKQKGKGKRGQAQAQTQISSQSTYGRWNSWWLMSPLIMASPACSLQ